HLRPPRGQPQRARRQTFSVRRQTSPRRSQSMSTTPTPAPPIGSMYLFDCVTPPLLDGSYRIDVVTNVTYDNQQAPLSSNSGYFDIEGPRFTLPATDVAAVYPPRNGHGGFDEFIPQIVISRRTLPWERSLTSRPDLIGTPTRDQWTPQPDPFPPVQGQPQEYGPAPWLALLVFQEGEYTLHQNVPLKTVVPADVYSRLEVPDGIVCDSIEVEAGLLQSVLPSLDELTLLAHVRQVNVDDKELNAASGDGLYAVLMSNRIPAPNAKFRACLVSLEERTDLVQANPPAVAAPIFGIIGIIENPGAGQISAANTANAQLSAATATQPASTMDSGTPQQTLVNATGSTILASEADRNVLSAVGFVASAGYHIFVETKQLVLLHSWTFECTGVGTFRDYVQRVNVSTMGTVEDEGHPPVIDTGHIPMTVMDRSGVEENVWYRGPLVPMPLTRDPLTYHSADQCRRVTPETGAEDITYAAAFECGRLLAAADPRLAQELMRWRREPYRQSVRIDSLAAIQAAIPLNETLDIHKPVVPVVAANAAGSIVTGINVVGDKYGIGAVSRAPGLDPAQLQQTWNLGSTSVATAILGGEPGATGAVVAAPAQTVRNATTLDQVVADTASLNRLQSARDQVLNAVQLQLGS
ncbi:MAG TPA: hypothetical protein VKU60_17025, partial [Chloroflexota bacterium]|nr:hypothetical protein [Chloroflexota bacterium]